MHSATRTDKQSLRDRRMGVALSACVHMLALLLLSLISLRAPDGFRHAFTMSDTSSTEAVQEMPAFDLEPQAVDPFDATPPEAQTTVDLQVQIPLPISTTSSLTSVSDAALAAGERDAPVAELDNSEFDGSLGDGVNARTVAAIQGRVGKAGGRKGEVQFALAWKNINDVDLHVIAPSGERISHMRRRSSCKGMLDVDMNVDGESTEPVENIRWIREAPMGRYTILVNMFQVHPGRRVDRSSQFELLAQLGNQTNVETGRVSLRNQVAVFRFHYVPETIREPQRSRMLTELENLQIQEEALAQTRLEQAKQFQSELERDRYLNDIIARYTHTDAAIEAMQLLGGSIRKR